MGYGYQPTTSPYNMIGAAQSLPTYDVDGAASKLFTDILDAFKNTNTVGPGGPMN